jgi:hypothetical protein
LKEPEKNMNIFFITMPVHQDKEPDKFAEENITLAAIKNC